MKALMIPVPHNNKPCAIDLDEHNELETYYKEIGCDCIDTCCLCRNNKVSIDAEVSLNAIRKVNQCLNESSLADKLFSAWLPKWEGYTLDDGSKVTKRAEDIANL